MTTRPRVLVSLFGALALLAATLAGCSVNPATGKQDFTAFMSPAQEAKVGREQNPKLLAAFGGAYEERPALTRYVTKIGRRLQAVSEKPSPPFTFTIVNSPTVNAFALPGGYIYVTRGLLALANSEAELAGVIGHEMGHVIARHTAQRYSRGVLAQLGALAVGAATGSRSVARIANLGAAAYVQGFSREQELEADKLGVRYLTRAGYDPRAMASFLESLEADSKLARRIAGKEGRSPAASLFASHPRTALRITQALARAGGASGGKIGHDYYLLRLDDTLWGDDPDQGIRRGRVFIHPKLRFRFEVPPGFHMRNTPKAVVATAKNGAAIVFDGARVPAGIAMTDHITGQWLPKLAWRDVEAITINGMAAATAAARVNTRRGPRDLRAVTIRFGRDQVYRFLILTPPKATAGLNEAMRRMTYSFRALSAEEAAKVKPLRVRIHEVKAGETVAALAARMAVPDYKLEWFRVLNALAPNEALRPGRLVKLIGE